MMLLVIVLQQSLIRVTENRQAYQEINGYDRLALWKLAHPFCQQTETPGT